MTLDDSTPADTSHSAICGILLLSHAQFNRSPIGTATLAVVASTQFPDLIDKPLAWTFDILRVGRSFAHSLFLASAVIILISIIAARHDRTTPAIAFGVGYLSHLAADAILPLIYGRYGKLA